METLLVGGDRLTEGASRNIQLSFADARSPQDRLEGLHFKYEDWHAIKNLFEVSELNNFLVAQKYLFCRIKKRGLAPNSKLRLCPQVRTKG